MQVSSGIRITACAVAFFLISVITQAASGASQVVLESKLTPTVVKAGQRFGESVSISGNTAVILAPMMNDHDRTDVSDIGYVFIRSAGTWTTQGRLTLLPGTPGGALYCAFCHNPHDNNPPYFNNELNFQVAVNGDTAVVTGGVSAGQGQARIFTRSADRWIEEQAIRDVIGDSTGSGPIPVAVQGDTIALKSATGVRVYVRNGSGWTVQTEVPSGDPLALSGNTMAVGRSSGADVFVSNGAVWTEEQTIILPGATQAGALALSGDSLLIGAPADTAAGTDAGAVYVYGRSGNAWTLQQTLRPSDAFAGQVFGFSLALDNDKAVIGAKTERAAYVFTRSGGVWSELEKIVPPSGGADGNGKFPISLSGNTIVIGAAGDDNGAADSGAAYIYAVNSPPTISTIGDQRTIVNIPTTISFTVGDAETAPSALTVSGSSSNTALVPAANMTFGGSGADRTLSIAPSMNQAGDAVITLSVSDGTASTMVSFTLSVINTPPAVSSIANPSTSVNVPVTVSFAVFDAETPAAALTVTATSSNTALVPYSGLLISGFGSNRTLTLTPAANQAGTAVITVTAFDGIATGYTTFSVAVVNTPPTISQIVDQGTTTQITIPVTVGDAETAPDYLTVSGSSSNTTLVPQANLAFSGTGANRSVTITPVTGQLGATVITVSVSDGVAVTNMNFTLTVINTSSGTDVVVSPGPGVTVTFSEVVTGGNTRLVTSTTNPGPVSKGFVFLGTYYDIITNATYSNTLTICLSYIDVGMTPQEEAGLQVRHLVGGVWTAVDEAFTNRDMANNVICGTVNSLSWFGIGLDDTAPAFNLNRLKDTLRPPDHKLVKAATVTDVRDAADPAPRVDIKVASKDVRFHKDRDRDNDKTGGDHDGRYEEEDHDADAAFDRDRHKKDWEVRRRNGIWEVWVRAELSEGSKERIYTITAVVTDRSGNKATATDDVRVEQGHGKQPRK